MNAMTFTRIDAVNKLSKRETVQEAKEQGWSVNQDGIVVCPFCKKRNRD